ncbi:MAG: putative sulfate exporter family transporter [Pseudomonadota bacterium]
MPGWIAAHLLVARHRMHGVFVSLVIAVAAMFVSEHYGAPAMLMALLMGMALQSLSEEGPCVAGIAFSARQILRLGVALMGARISFGLAADLGAGVIGLLLAGVLFTILFGVLGARVMARGWRFGVLTGGSVAICGASAAMALSAVLPKNEHSERNLTFTVLSVTVLSTVAMIAYPLLGSLLDLDALAAGVFLGGTIHDVAQVVGAGFSVSEATGEAATLVKLMRVMMLAPVVLVLTLVVARMAPSNAEDGGRPLLVPGFILGFLALATLNSLGLIPPALGAVIADLSGWALLTSIAAVGLKTSLGRIMEVGGQAIVLIVLETLFLGVFILGGLMVLG